MQNNISVKHSMRLQKVWVSNITRYTFKSGQKKSKTIMKKFDYDVYMITTLNNYRQLTV